MGADIGCRDRLVCAQAALDRRVPFVGERDLQVGIDRTDICGAATGYKGKWRGLKCGVGKVERDGSEDQVRSRVWEKDHGSSEVAAITEVVVTAKSPSQHSLRSELKGSTEARGEVVEACMPERCTRGRQAEWRGVKDSRHRIKRLPRSDGAHRSVNLPAQAIGQREARGDLPNVLGEEGVVVNCSRDWSAAGSEDGIDGAGLQTSVAVRLNIKTIVICVGGRIEMSKVCSKFKLVRSGGKGEVVYEVELLLRHSHPVDRF